MLQQLVAQLRERVHPRFFPAPPAPVLAGFEATWASTWAEVREAQRLRYRVFAQELGARVPSRRHGLDADEFDAYCDHLLVREPNNGEVVGTYRVLSPQQASSAGGLYSDQVFDLGNLTGLRSNLAELGRACVDARFRQGGVILALWAALAEYMMDRQVQWMIGCCSVPLQGGRGSAAALWHQLSRTHLAEPCFRVRPLLPLPVDTFNRDSAAETPPLLKGYLRLGAKVLGPPAWDSDFGSADLPVLLRLDDLPPRYRRHYLERAASN